MLDMADTSRPIDIVTLSEELSRHKELEAVGGVAYLSSLTDGTPRRTSIEHYVRIVRDKSLVRGVIRAANTIMQNALDQSDTAADVLDRAEAEIFSLSENRNQQDLVSVAQVAMDSFGATSTSCMSAAGALPAWKPTLAISTNLPAGCNARN